MQNVMGVINLIDEESDMGFLTENRCLASLPFGGRYRLIDFVLSSMVNSGIRNVSVFMHAKYRSIMDHMGSGKEWDLDRKRNGLFLLPPENDEAGKGDLRHFYDQQEYFNRSKEEYVILSRGYIVANIDFREAMQAHVESGAMITMLYKKTNTEYLGKCRKVSVDRTGNVVEIKDHAGGMESALISMEIYIMDKNIFWKLVEGHLDKGDEHFVQDVIIKNIGDISIHGYEYKGYLGVLNTFQNYYSHSMDLLDANRWKSLFYDPQTIYTKIKDEPPSQYLEGARVSNSLIANGCVINGVVENSILFRGVTVHKDAYIKNSILLQSCQIYDHVQVEHAILDKYAVIHPNNVLHGKYWSPYIVSKRQEIS